MKFIIILLITLVSTMSHAQEISDKLIIDSDVMVIKNGLLTETFGIRIYDGSIAPFSKVGENFPINGSYSFSTDEDNQDQITLEFHRSTESMASPESYIGTVQIRGYKLEPARKPLVRVFYEIANNKITIWAANEKQNGKLSLSMIKNKLGKSVH